MSRPSSLFPLYLGFAATGVGVALPGAILPVLLMRWKLEDVGGGNLFLLAFVGSSIGALLVSGRLFRAVALGSGTIAAAAVGMGMVPAKLAFGCMFLFGLGLGSTMTAISLSVQWRTQGESRALVRLNLLWALGASLCPVLALETLRTASPGAILYPLAVCFVLLAMWAVRQEAGGAAVKEDTALPPTPRGILHVLHSPQSVAVFFVAMPAILIVLIMLTTGVEAAAGGWLATYAKRGGDPFAGIVAAPTCLWVGVLLSRLFWSLAPRVKQDRFVIQGSLLLMAGAALTLLAARHGWLFFLAAMLLGAGVGPVYPLLLAKALRFHASGTIFFLAGVGSALLPWAMGFVSTRSRSLHTGFYVPAIGACVMVVLSLWLPAHRVRAAAA